LVFPFFDVPPKTASRFLTIIDKFIMCQITKLPYSPIPM
jgi:hypothetical protein